LYADSHSGSRTHRIALRAPLIAFGLALLCTTIGLVAEIRYGLNIWDEGFLWYGVQRVWAGEVPIRDFMAYDPGRYYWTAVIASAWHGRGILDIRIAVAVFQFLGLAAGIGLIGRAIGWHRPIFLLFAGALLTIWMFPRHKLFDISLSIMLVALLAWWISRPNAWRHFWTGAALGMVACFGRNHGLYGFVGCSLAFAWMAFENRRLPSWRHVLAWAGGIVVGFLPVILACLVVPGFADAFWESIAFLFEVKSTNLPLPIPWPWSADYVSLPWAEGGRRFLVGACFILLLAYPLVGFVSLWRQKDRTSGRHVVLVSTACMALPYAHYAFSRADVGHLAQSIFPALIGCLVILSSAKTVVRALCALALGGASACIALPLHPAFACATSGQCCNEVLVSGQRLILNDTTASDVALVRRLINTYAPKGRAFVTTPYWPGAYALANQRSPLWEIYATPSRTAAFQEAEIGRLKAANPGFVLIMDFPLDNREELRYSRTHPVMLKYVQDHFTRVSSSNPNYLIYVARDI